MNARLKIAIHAFDGMTMFHLATPLLVFGEVSRLGLAPGWETVLFAEQGRAVRSAEGYLVDGVSGLEAVQDADLVVLPSWLPDLPDPSAELQGFIRRSHARGAVVAGLCLGAYPAARSGVLDGRSAVTHWGAAADMASRLPAVRFDESALYVDHGDVLTSAGTAAALDACLHLVRNRLGSAAAADVARHIVVAPHREGGQAQYIARPLQDPQLDGPLGKTIEWALANLDQDLEVEAMAAQAKMSKRNFTRRFKELTGLSPARWVLGRRLDEARQLLETTTWSVARIAGACGFGSAVTFRQNFARAYATSPSSYRARFASR